MGAGPSMGHHVLQTEKRDARDPLLVAIVGFNG
jgi:hypothetical protein